MNTLSKYCCDLRVLLFIELNFNPTKNTTNIRYIITDMREPGSVVGIATAYGLDGPGIQSRWGRDFPHLSGPAVRPTQPPVQWVPGLSRG